MVLVENGYQLVFFGSVNLISFEGLYINHDNGQWIVINLIDDCARPIRLGVDGKTIMGIPI